MASLFRVFDAEDRALNLVRQAVGLAVGRAVAIAEGVEACLIVAVDQLVAGDAGDAELAAQGSHLLAAEIAANKLQSFMQDAKTRTLNVR